MDQYIGKSLDRYQILNLIGEGGMGSVYRAHDPRLDRDIAIKLMHPYLSRQPNFQERFLQEARAAARLNHPGIVKVHDSGQAGEVLYIVMEFLQGDNLKQLLSRMKNAQQWLSITEAAHLIRQICLAVEYSHQHGVFFRDIKPDNIMFRDERVEVLPYRPVLTDLGLAKLADEISITRDGESMGTPAYISPEQSLGQSTDARSDLYSLGILFFELATRQLPFEVMTLAEAIRCHTKIPPPSPRFLNPELPMAVEDILLKSLQKDPMRRFQTAAEMAEAIALAIPPVAQPKVDGTDTQEQTFTLMTQYQSSLVRESLPGQFNQNLTPPDNLPYDRIQIFSKDHTARYVYIRGGAVTIGRADDNDIALPQINVSQHHARIEYDGKNYSIVDLKSTNGTFQDGAKLLPGLPVTWQPGKLVQIGDFWLQLDLAQKSYLRLPAQKEEEFGIATIVDSGEVINPLSGMSETLSGQAATQTYEKTTVAPKIEEIHPILPVPAVFEMEVSPSKPMSVVEGLFSIYLRNHGSYPLLLTLEALSAEENLRYTFSQTQVNLPVGDVHGRTEVTLSVGLKAPKEGNSPLAHPFTVRACPAEQPDNERLASAEWIQTIPDIRLDLESAVAQSENHKSFNIVLKNNSSDELNVQLEASDPQGSLSFGIQSPQIRLKVGERAIVPMQVKKNKPIISETDTTYRFMITAKVMEAPEYTQQLQGEWGKIQPEKSKPAQKFLGHPFIGAWIVLILGWAASPILLEIINQYFCLFCIRDWAYNIGMGDFGAELFLITILVTSTGILNGLVTGIALRIAKAQLSFGAILLIILGWGFALSGTIYFLLSIDAGDDASQWFGIFLPGAIGGLITGLALMRTRLHSINFLQALSIMIAWSVSRGMGILILDQLGGYYPGDINHEMFLGAISALIGGGWTLYQIFRSRSPTQVISH